MTNSSLSVMAALALALSTSASFAGGYAIPLFPNLQFPADAQSATKDATPQSYVCIESDKVGSSSNEACSMPIKAK